MEVILSLCIFLKFTSGELIFIHNFIGIVINFVGAGYFGLLAIKGIRKSIKYTTEIHNVERDLNNLYIEQIDDKKEHQIEITKQSETDLSKENDTIITHDNDVMEIASNDNQPEDNRIEEPKYSGPRLVYTNRNSRTPDKQ
jgi:hypothetical protein